MSKDKRLVWSDDPKDRAKVEGKSGAPKPKTNDVVVDGWTAVFRLEKAGRGGKTVTVLDQMPKHETFLKQLCKDLKARCGSGGTFDADRGLIEIQGDQRAPIKAYFEKKKYRFKGM